MKNRDFDRIVDVFGIKEGLGNPLHSKIIYDSSRKEQKKWLEKVENIIKDFDDGKLRAFGRDRKTAKKINKLIKLRTSKNYKTWMNVVMKFFKGLRYLLQRELRLGKPISRKNLDKLFISEIKKQSFYNSKDLIKTKKTTGKIEIWYISLNKSPGYNKKFVLWRDTEFKIIILLDKGLFVWMYLNVNDKYKNKGLGTKMAKAMEQFARKRGIKRFSVEWPNRNYWRYKLGYTLPNKLCIGREGYSLECFK